MCLNTGNRSRLEFDDRSYLGCLAHTRMHACTHARMHARAYRYGNAYTEPCKMTVCHGYICLRCTIEEPSSSKDTPMHIILLCVRHKRVFLLALAIRRKHLVFFNGVNVFGLPTFETHTFGSPPFGFTSALNVKAFVVSVVQTTRHWHVKEAVILNLIFASLTSVTFPPHSRISLAEMVY